MAAVSYVEEHVAEGEVRASARELWNLLTDPIEFAKARSDITEIQVLEGAMGEVGCRTRTMHKINKTELMITEDWIEVQKPRLIVKQALNPQVTSTARWEIEERDGGCKVTVTSTLEAKLGFVQRWAVKRQELRRGRDAIDAVRKECDELSAYFDKRRQSLGFEI